MPIYEYECSACGKTFETFVGINDKPLKKCTLCKSTKIKKLISSCSFQLKGSGWYATDYAKKDSKGKKGESKAEKSEASDSTSKTSDTKDSGTTSDSKPTETKESNKAA